MLSDPLDEYAFVVRVFERVMHAVHRDLRGLLQKTDGAKLVAGVLVG